MARNVIELINAFDDEYNIFDIVFKIFDMEMSELDEEYKRSNIFSSYFSLGPRYSDLINQINTFVDWYYDNQPSYTQSKDELNRYVECNLLNIKSKYSYGALSRSENRYRDQNCSQ